MANKINLDNIQSALNKVQTAAAQTENAAYDQMIFAQLIIPHPENIYALEDDEESIQALASEIQMNGLINAITVFRCNDGKYQIISGERRFRAMTEVLHWTQIRCRIYDGISEDKAELMLHTANLEAREYTPAQKIVFYEKCMEILTRLKASGEYTGSIQKGIADRLQVTDRQVRKYKTICEHTTKEEREEIANGDMNLTEAYAIASERKTGTSSGDKPSQAKKKTIRYTLHEDTLQKYFSPELKKQEIESIIEKALAFYYASQKDTEKNRN